MSLDVEGLRAGLQERLRAVSLGRPAFIYESLPSTQDEARRRARQGAPEGTLVWALEQTAGRGRVGRAWVSARGAGLWVSVILRPRMAPHAVAFLTIVAGVGIAQGLAPLQPSIRLKWPNDLLVDDLKLGGILAEAESEGETLRHVVLGCGINLVPPSPSGELAQATGLSHLRNGAPDPVEALCLLLSGLEATYRSYLESGAQAIRDAWLARSATIGRQVQAELGASQVIAGKAVDLDLEGSLVVEASRGQRYRIASGEVIHLR